jgi:maltose O-acetyltransferase
MTAPTHGPAHNVVHTFVRTAWRDLRFGAARFLLVSIAGAALLPRSVSRWIYRAAGARTASPPGIGFVLSGPAANLTVGRSVYFNQQVFVETVAPVTIGDECAFGMQTLITTSHHPRGTDGRWQHEAEPRAVRIGDRVWVGARATILPGTEIESDVVVAAGAVVRGRCRSGGLYAGVPARRVRELSEPVVPADAATATDPAGAP